MRLDTSKLANKDDLIAGIAMLVIFLLFGLVLYLAATQNSFLAGFIAATATWKWKSWLYEPVDKFLEKNWPFPDGR